MMIFSNAFANDESVEQKQNLYCCKLRVACTVAPLSYDEPTQMPPYMHLYVSRLLSANQHIWRRPLDPPYMTTGSPVLDVFRPCPTKSLSFRMI